VPHQENVASAGRPNRQADGIAESVVRDHIVADAAAVEKITNRRASAVDARLVVGAAVDIDQGFEQVLHSRTLRREPVEHLAFMRQNGGAHDRDNRGSASRAAVSMVMKTAPSLRSLSTSSSNARIR
jgi:hypothetical protein